MDMNNLKTIKQFEVDDDDLYGMLEVQTDATVEEIRKAYKKLAGIYHPDKKTGNEELFKAIKQAYDILIDPVKRSNYNATGIYKGNDLEKVEAARGAVENRIAGIIDFALDQIENIDIVETLKQDIVKNIKVCDREIKQLNKKIDKLNKNKKRAKGIILNVFNKKIKAKEEEKEDTMVNKELFEISSKIIKTCVYEFEQEQGENGYQFWSDPL